MKYSQSRTWTNRWGASISAEVSKVKALVSYDVTYGNQTLYEYVTTLQPGQAGRIDGLDLYHVQEWYARTEYYNDGMLIGEERGTGWSAQWYAPHFRSVTWTAGC